MGELVGVFIVGIVMAVPITAIITSYKNRTLQIRATMLKDEIELERVKQQNFIMETEKMKLELEQMKLEYKTDSNELLKL